MDYTIKILLQVLLFSFYHTVLGQEVFNYKLRLDKNITADSVVVVINNYHDFEAIDWPTPFEYQRIKLRKNENNEYYGQGSLEYNLASGKLLIFSDTKRATLELLVKSGLNSVQLNKIDYSNSTLTRQKYLSFDDELSKPNILLNSLVKLQNEFYDKYGVAALENPIIKTLPDSASNALKIATINLLKTESSSEFSLLKLFEIFNSNNNDSNYVLYSEAFNSLTSELKNTSLGKQFSERLASKLNTFERLSVGSQVPELIAYDEENNIFSNANFEDPYILAFGATWCIPCKENLPRLIRLKNELNIEVIYVNLDDDIERWRKSIKDNLLDWINVTDNKKINKSKIAEDFNIFFLPKYFVVDKAGKIVYTMDVLEKNDDTESLESFINRAVNEDILVQLGIH